MKILNIFILSCAIFLAITSCKKSNSPTQTPKTETLAPTRLDSLKKLNGKRLFDGKARIFNSGVWDTTSMLYNKEENINVLSQDSISVTGDIMKLTLYKWKSPNSNATFEFQGTIGTHDNFHFYYYYDNDSVVITTFSGLPNGNTYYWIFTQK